ncbi:unnamed protein product [Allacma fusca]|uniref:BAG domain-containing protein n=1 Tax=Allacma fusca TaxID=39272 RepID=A0A8J2P0Z9_9HEXA|nr:unnamed protein product [Allacma fusca]
MLAPDVQPYLGSYDPLKRNGATLGRDFDSKAEPYKRRRREANTFLDRSLPEEKIGATWSHTYTRPLPEEKIDPLIKVLDDILKEICKYQVEVDTYTSKHINQDFRRINASLLQLQLKLDKVNVDGRDDARKLRKEGIFTSERAANDLMEKIHMEDYRSCDSCLKL